MSVHRIAAPLLLATIATACGHEQSLREGVEVACTAWEPSGAATVPPARRAEALARWLSPRITNPGAQNVVAAIASARADERASVLLRGANEAGLTSCPLADHLREDAILARPTAPTEPAPATPPAAPTPPPSSAGTTRERVARGEVSMGPVVEEGGSGQLAASAVETPLRRLRAGIRSCYESSLRLDSTLRGRIDVVFTVAESGRVSSASVQGMDARPELASCVSGRFRGLVVVPHPEGGSVSLRVSYVLSTR